MTKHTITLTTRMDPITLSGTPSVTFKSQNGSNDLQYIDKKGNPHSINDITYTVEGDGDQALIININEGAYKPRISQLLNWNINPSGSRKYAGRIEWSYEGDNIALRILAPAKNEDEDRELDFVLMGENGPSFSLPVKVKRLKG